MKIIFAGTPLIAETVLLHILASGFNVDLVLTKPDSKANRGKKITSTPVKNLAISHGIKVLQPNTLKNNPEVLDLLHELKPDLMIVVAYGLILPQELLDIPRLGCINIHVSLLPKYRGAAPIQRAVLNGDAQSGVTVMQMDAGLDTGDILMQRAIKLDKKETSGSLHDRLASIGADMVVQYLNEYEKIKPIKQSNYDISYASKLEKSEAEINWMENIGVIERKIRGFNPFPGCFTHLDGRLFKIWQTEITPLPTVMAPGTIVDANNTGIYVACNGGLVLKIVELQEEGNSRQLSHTYVLGHHGLLGKKFT